jgi:hypothetical protein
LFTTFTLGSEVNMAPARSKGRRSAAVTDSATASRSESSPYPYDHVAVTV